LLLVSGLLDEFSVAEDLEVDQAAADGDAPQGEDGTEKVEARILSGSGSGRRHRFSALSFREAQRRNLLFISATQTAGSSSLRSSE
jgi:hypothetical protein